MKKKIFLSLLCGLMTLTLVTGCGNNNFDSNDNNDNNNNSNNNSTSKWGLQINGEDITLPCTLSDLSKAGITITGDYDKETILNSTNKTFTPIAASDGENGQLFLKIETGANVDKKEQNATVKIITNNRQMQKNSFGLKNGIGLGSSIDDVINTFGNNYVVDSSVSDDLHDGFVMTHYGNDKDGILLWYQDGVLNYIEIYSE